MAKGLSRKGIRPRSVRPTTSHAPAVSFACIVRMASGDHIEVAPPTSLYGDDVVRDHPQADLSPRGVIEHGQVEVIDARRVLVEDLALRLHRKRSERVLELLARPRVQTRRVREVRLHHHVARAEPLDRARDVLALEPE